MDVKKPVAVITGANRGIGRGIALRLSGEGYNIVGVSRTLKGDSDKPGLIDIKYLIEEKGTEFLPYQMDVGDLKAHDGLLQVVDNKFGRIDLLVNNAGVAPLVRDDILKTTEESFDRVLSINLKGSFFLTQIVAKYMIEKRRPGSENHPGIVFITSISAEWSSTSRVEYCVSKAGLSMASKVYAQRLIDEGIFVYEIRPGLIETDMVERVKEKYNPLIADGFVPQKRWGTPEDIAKVVASIARGDFDYSPGAIIEISGGMNIRRL
jgi:NAD(P)-dependent dehydrogenase (short-subunit alcohol dehydrogenase family)